MQLNLDSGRALLVAVVQNGLARQFHRFHPILDSTIAATA